MDVTLLIRLASITVALGIWYIVGAVLRSVFLDEQISFSNRFRWFVLSLRSRLSRRSNSKLYGRARATDLDPLSMFPITTVGVVPQDAQAEQIEQYRRSPHSEYPVWLQILIEIWIYTRVELAKWWKKEISWIKSSDWFMRLREKIRQQRPDWLKWFLLPITQTIKFFRLIGSALKKAIAFFKRWPAAVVDTIKSSWCRLADLYHRRPDWLKRWPAWLKWFKVARTCIVGWVKHFRNILVDLFHRRPDWLKRWPAWLKAGWAKLQALFDRRPDWLKFWPGFVKWTKMISGRSVDWYKHYKWQIKKPTSSPAIRIADQTILELDILEANNGTFQRSWYRSVHPLLILLVFVLFAFLVGCLLFIPVTIIRISAAAMISVLCIACFSLLQRLTLQDSKNSWRFLSNLRIHAILDDDLLTGIHNLVPDRSNPFIIAAHQAFLSGKYHTGTSILRNVALRSGDELVARQLSLMDLVEDSVANETAGYCDAYMTIEKHLVASNTRRKVSAHSLANIVLSACVVLSVLSIVVPVFAFFLRQ